MTEDRPRRIAWIHGRVVHRYGIQPGLLTRGAVESLVQKIDLPGPGASRAAAILRPALNSGRPPLRDPAQEPLKARQSGAPVSPAQDQKNPRPRRVFNAPCLSKNPPGPSKLRISGSDAFNWRTWANISQ